MKKLTIIFYLFLIPLCVFAQNESSISHTKTVNDSTLIKIHAIVEDIDFRMHGLDRYKLYPTENIYNFLQLDTMTGKIEIVQWSLDDDKEGSATLNNEDLSLGTGCGTFELYPTKNIYQFLLLAYIIHSGFISGYQNRYGDNLKPPTNVYHRMTA